MMKKLSKALLPVMLLLAWNIATQAQTDTSRWGAGSTINSSGIDVTVTIDGINGSDANDGVTASVKTIQKGFDLAKAQCKNGKNTRVLIKNGTYRETGRIAFGLTGETGDDKKLIIDGESTGGVIVKGSDLVNSSALTTEASGVYSFAWSTILDTYVGNLASENLPKGDFAPHREMVFVNGVRYQQIITSQADLTPGSFYAASGRYYIKPASGTTLSSSTIEVAVRPLGLQVQKSNVMVSNLIIEHVASKNHEAPDDSKAGLYLASRFEPYFTRNLCTNIRLENIEIRNNNGDGLYADGTDHLTMKNVKMNGNGINGFHGAYVRYNLWLDCEAQNNGWRMIGATYWWALGGVKFSWEGNNNTIRRFKSINNQGQNFWHDGNHFNTEMLDCEIRQAGERGLMYEISEGPFYVDNCIISDNTQGGLWLAQSRRVYVTNCTIQNNGQFGIGVPAKHRAESVDGEWRGPGYDTLAKIDQSGKGASFFPEKLRLHNTTITTNKGAKSYLIAPHFGDASDIDWQAFLDSYVGDNNKFYNADNINSFYIKNDEGSGATDFAGWKQRTKQDANSVWGDGITNKPNPASTVAASTVSDSKINITWKDNSSNENGFQLYRKRGNDSYYQIASLNANTTSYSDAGLTAGQAYTYRVLAYNTGGGDYSNESSASTSPATAGSTVFAANCGGGIYKASNGIQYEADYNFSGGTAYLSGAIPAISGTSDATLYSSERYGNPFSYKIPLANGTYSLTLYMAETFQSAAGARKFTTKAEGITILGPDFDLFATAGKNTAYVLTKSVTVSDGELTIDFSASADNAKVNAIMVTTGPTGAAPFPVTGVSITPASISIATGSTTQLSATVAPSNATNKSVSWTTSNSAVATVSATGLVTGVAVGSATITVTTADQGKTATSAITVTASNVAVTGVSVSPTTASVTVGGTQQLTATVSPGNATNKSVSWTTSNSAVATVSSTGLVTGVGAGSATITATTTDQGKTATSAITVTAPTANCTVNSALNKTATASSGGGNGSNTADKAFDGNTSTRWESDYSDAQWLQIDLGSKFNICEVKITWEYASAASYNIQVSDDATTWTTIKSYSSAVNARVDDLTGLSGAGRYVRMQGITRTSPYGYSIYEMAVYGGATGTNVPVSGVSIAPTSISIAAGSTSQLSATVTPSNATNPNVTWSSSNSAVATVSATGLVTGVGAGSATITVTTTDQGKIASSSITVTAPTINCTINSALNKTATASSVRSNGSNTADKAFDGNGSTRWESEYADAQWLQIDLGSKFNICEVKITWEYAAAASYNIQVSDDATTWTTIKSYSNASSGRTDDLTGLSGAGRYVRMQGVTRTSPYGYSIYEMAVYGSAASGAGLKVGSDVESTAHVAEVQSATMLLYPNPVTNGIFTVELSGIIQGTSASIKVYDMSGKVVLRSNTAVHEGQAIFNIKSQLQNGIYIVHVVAGNQLWNKKMVIR